MQENELLNQLYSYFFYGTGLLIFIASVFFFNAAVFLIAVFCMLLAGACYSSGHIINNFLIRRSKVIEVYNGYTLNSDLLAASKRVGNGHQAVSVAVLRLNKGVQNRADAVRKILENISEPFEFCIEASEVNKKAVLEALETKRRMKEIALTRIESRSYDRINEAKRELNVFDEEIESIRAGGKGFKVRIKIKSRANSPTDSEACNMAYRNLEKVSASFSSILGLDYEILKGETLMKELEVM